MAAIGPSFLRRGPFLDCFNRVFWLRRSLRTGRGAPPPGQTRPSQARSAETFSSTCMRYGDISDHPGRLLAGGRRCHRGQQPPRDGKTKAHHLKTCSRIDAQSGLVPPEGVTPYAQFRCLTACAEPAELREKRRRVMTIRRQKAFLE